MTIKEYWNLIGRETFSAINWESDFSQACSFRRMLMSHKNFHFTQIPHKTNNVIFWKVEKPCFGAIFDHFGHFCPMEIFSKKSGSVTRNYIWAPWYHVSFRKNWWTDGRTDGRTDRPYFTRPFLPRPGVEYEDISLKP